MENEAFYFGLSKLHAFVFCHDIDNLQCNSILGIYSLGLGTSYPDLGQGVSPPYI